jgi:hypothetical protein
MSGGSGNGAILIERFPCSLGPIVRLAPLVWPVEINASAGLVVGALRARGTGFAADYESVRLELGARLAVEATFHVGQRPGDVAPLLGVQATYDPITYDLEASPHGVVGHTPSVWAGASAGVSWGVL